MDFLEVVFGIASDQGSGSLEFLLLIVVVAGVVVRVTMGRTLPKRALRA